VAATRSRDLGRGRESHQPSSKDQTGSGSRGRQNDERLGVPNGSQRSLTVAEGAAMEATHRATSAATQATAALDCRMGGERTGRGIRIRAQLLQRRLGEGNQAGGAARSPRLLACQFWPLRTSRR
jgi:hypothetical protein